MRFFDAERGQCVNTWPSEAAKKIVKILQRFEMGLCRHTRMQLLPKFRFEGILLKNN